MVLDFTLDLHFEGFLKIFYLEIILDLQGVLKNRSGRSRVPFAPSLKGDGFRKRDGAGPGGRHRLCAGRTAASAPPCARADAASSQCAS